ncbi:MAG: NifB/NifX family molybdenum-iron cluster-binding protein [Thermodesulfobacteriota bacterium]
MNTLIAVPSNQPGGLDAPLGAHFGHCDVYTLISVSNGEIANVDVIPNIPHQQGGCMAPVRYLADKGVKKLIAGGMGMRPLMGFNEVGIEVYHGGPARAVKDAVTFLIQGDLQQFSTEHTCGAKDPAHQCGGH